MGERAFQISLGNETFDVWEQVDSPKIKYGRDTSQISAIYKVRWADRRKVAIALLGKTEVGSDGTRGYLKRDPLPHRYTLDDATLFCRFVNPEPMGPRGQDADGHAQYKWAILKTDYGLVPYYVTDDDSVKNNGFPDESYFAAARDEATGESNGIIMRWISKKTTPRPRRLEYKQGSWQWTETGRPVPLTVTTVIQGSDIVYTHHEIPRQSFNEDRILALAGCTNDKWFDSKAPGTLLFNGAEYEPTILADGTEALNAHFFVGFNSVGWNRFPDSTHNNEFRKISRNNGTVFPFPPADLREMFRLR